MDEGGYDAYRVEKRFGPWENATWEATTQAATQSTRASRQATTQGPTPNRYSMRLANLTTQQVEMVRGGGWPLELLREHVDQFVIHYDVAGVSQTCFKVLHDMRNLSVHFMLDIDGTIYQTLDLKERARHATKANDRSIGIEIANMGSYTLNDSVAPLSQWYAKDDQGRTVITVPERLNGGGVRTPNFLGNPLRDDMVVGEIQGHMQRQYDYTPQQYAALIKLTAALCRIFPKIRCDYPRDPETGMLITRTLDDEFFTHYNGVLGHFHVQTNKSDPGPAFQWDLVIDGARQLLKNQPPFPSALASNSR
jgi:N-acetylmuramoyl-L-alanine amidase